ncbi:MAG: hypothetical protein QM765_34270 [Myxococcales bacterium]
MRLGPCLLLLLLTWAPSAFASTQILNSSRVRVVAEQDLQGPSEGFLTLRVHAENLTGHSQRVTLRFESRPNADVSAELDLAGAERRTLDLLIPAYARYGQLSADDGRDRRSESFSWHWQSHDPILLEGPTAGAELVARGKSPDGSPTSFAAAIAVSKEQLPSSLAALVGYAAVGVLETPFEELPEPQRRALEAYAATGGELFLAQVPTRPETALPLWRGTRAEGPHPYGLGHVHLYRDAARCVDALHGVGEIRRAASTNTTSYNRGYGPSPSNGDPLIAVARVPVGGFLLLVLLFVFVIGPGSFVLRARKGPGALMLFIPLTAMATCGGIAGYGVLHEGVLTVHAASRAVTFLDAEHHRAATLSVDGFYASLAPSVVRYAALASPIPPQGSNAQDLEIDLTSGLTFRGGFIPSRTYREHLDAVVAPSRARLSARSAGQGQATVQNALGAKVVDGAVKLDGRICLFYALADGASGTASCSEGASFSPALRERFWGGLKDRFTLGRLDDNAFGPLEDGDFLVSLDRAVFAPDLGFSVTREGDFQLVRGRVSP